MTRFILLKMSMLAILFVGDIRAEAQTVQNPSRFEVGVGGFITENSTSLRVDSNTLGRGTTIDFEDDLGFEADDSGFRVDAVLRFGNEKRHQITATYFDLSRSAGATIDRDIQFGDRDFSVNADLVADFELGVYKIGYSYAFWRSDRSELGANAGLFVSELAASIQERGVGVREESDVTVPLPTIGLSGRYQLSDHIQLRMQGDVFFLDAGSFGGQLIDLSIGGDYWVNDRIAVGLGYNFVEIDGDVERDQGDVSASLEFSGAVASLRAAF